MVGLNCVCEYNRDKTGCAVALKGIGTNRCIVEYQHECRCCNANASTVYATCISYTGVVNRSGDNLTRMANTSGSACMRQQQQPVVQILMYGTQSQCWMTCNSCKEGSIEGFWYIMYSLSHAGPGAAWLVNPIQGKCFHLAHGVVPPEAAL